jgi:hypothetical protein
VDALAMRPSHDRVRHAAFRPKEKTVFRCFLVNSFLLLTVTATDALAQRNAGTGSVSVSAKVGGKSYQATGPGSCRHTPTASIYDVPAALWMVEHEGSGKAAIQRINFTLWKPKNGSPEQLSLALTTQSSSHRMAVGGRGEQVGSGKATLTPSGAGGTFSIKGKDGSGTSLELVIECSAFTGVEAEGG